MLLEVKNVTGREKGFCLRDISFSLEEGYLLGIAGKNGAGKTTLLRYFMEPEGRYDGEILLDGKEIRLDRTDRLNKIGFVSEENIFFEQYTIEQNIDLLNEFYNIWDQDLFAWLLKEMGIHSGQKIESLSRGERVKFQIALSAAHKPRLYLMDEPTAGMDPVFRKEFFRLLQTLLSGEDCAVMMTTHIEEEIERKMDLQAVMDGGRLVSFRETLAF